MKIDIIGKGKLSWFIEEYFNSHELEYFDDAVIGCKDTHSAQSEDIFISIGHTEFRKHLFEFYQDRKILSLVSDRAYVSPTVVVGAGSFINNFCSIHPNVKLGKGCLVHPNTVIDIGTEVGDFCRFGSQVYVGEYCSIGDGAVIGSGVTILPGIKIGSNCEIMAGSLVNKNIGDNERVAGSPIRTLGVEIGKSS